MELDSKKLECKLREFLQERNLTSEELLTELSELFDVLGKDWEKNCQRLEEALSLFLVKAKCKKEDMMFVCLTVIEWRACISDINIRIELIRGLKELLEDLKQG